MNPPFTSRLLISFVVAGLLTLASVHGQASKESDETELGCRLDQFNASWQTLHGQGSDPAQNEASLVLIVKIRETARALLSLSPRARNFTPAMPPA